MGLVKTKIKGLYLDGDKYIIDKNIKGQRLHLTIGAVPLKVAERILYAKVAEVLEGYFLPFSRSLKLSEVMQKYCEQHLIKLEKSWTQNKASIKNIMGYLGDIKTGNFKPQNLYEYQQYRIKKGINPITINRETSFLINGLDWATRNNIIPKNPISGYDLLKVEKKEIKIISPEEFKILLDNIVGDYPELYRTIFKIQYETGMRISEVLKLHWNWIDFVNKIIVLPAEQTKANTQRAIPMSEELIAILNSLEQKNLKLFSLSKSNIINIFSKASQACGFNYTTHCIRKTRATIWAEIDDKASKEAIGHTTDAMHYGKYAKITSKRLGKLIDKNLVDFKQNKDAQSCKTANE